MKLSEKLNIPYLSRFRLKKWLFNYTFNDLSGLQSMSLQLHTRKPGGKVTYFITECAIEQSASYYTPNDRRTEREDINYCRPNVSYVSGSLRRLVDKPQKRIVSRGGFVSVHNFHHRSSYQTSEIPVITVIALYQVHSIHSHMRMFSEHFRCV